MVRVDSFYSFAPNGPSLDSITWDIVLAQRKKINIGFSIEAMKGERWQIDLKEFQQRAHELEGSVVTRSANGDDDPQFRQINELLKSGIDVLVFLPYDTSKAGRVVEATCLGTL